MNSASTERSPHWTVGDRRGSFKNGLKGDDTTPRMTAILRNSGSNVNVNHHTSSHDFRLLTTEPPQQSEELGDLQSLSWLTTVDVPRLQQMATGRLAFNNAGPQSSILELHTDQQSNMSTALGHNTMAPPHSNMQNTYIGMNYLNNQNGNMAGLPGSAVPASEYQSSPAHYFHSPQQAYSQAQAVQQHSPSSLYNSTSYHKQNLYDQQAAVMSITNPHSNQDLLQQPKAFPKPIYSYSCLIAMALKNSRTGSLPVSEIYGFMKEHFPYFKTAPDGWKNSVRHNLSLNKCFEKEENKQGGSSSTSRKGCLWALNPAKINKMEEEMQKWKRKDLTAIRHSMANPDELDRLITDRPDGCRRKPCDPRRTCVPSRPCGPPLSGHLQSSLPFHLQAQNHTLKGEPISPVPARTPPLHAVPDYSHSPFPQPQPYRHPYSHSLYSLHPDVTAEVDALDSSIMEFAGSLWEEMREEGFSLESLGTFNQSDCELTGPSTGQPLVDRQVAGLYTTLDTAPAVPSQYITTTEARGQAIAQL
ncbi:forkhead box protein N4 [Salmo trutta]|uniref:forkhead box protein N4 n=1 Tax=Salmo trutta TaxID=8032 RepID=UPI001130088E|nr:forkhead box protein N4-like [Salmo trutta]